GLPGRHPEGWQLMSVPAIGGAGGVNLPQLAAMYRQQVIEGTDAAQNAPGAPARAAAARGADFAKSIGDGLQQLDGLDKTASDLAVQAATGGLTDVPEYTTSSHHPHTTPHLPPSL